MHFIETVNQFLNLRVQGWSFSRIADHLHVSKRTLLDWSHKHQSAFQTLKGRWQRSAQEGLQASHEQEVQRLKMFYSALCQELVSRTLKEIPTDEIEAIARQIEQQIENLNGEESGSPVQASPGQSSQIQPPPPSR